MDRATLELLLEQGLSLAEIAKRCDLHESTVGYWIKKHRLEAVNRDKHAARGALAREELELLADTGMSIAQIADAVERSKATVRHWLGKYGMRTNGSAGGQARLGSREARDAGLSKALLMCPRHGQAEHVTETRGYFRCRACRREAVVRRRRRVKETLVDEAGGSCRLCGYDRSPAALHFHHIDPTDKRFGVAQHGMGRGIERLRAEARKCVLLCSNCHAEVESGICSISLIAQPDDPG